MPETQAFGRGGLPRPPSDILSRIVETKREELRSLTPLGEELRARALDAPPARDFRAALRRRGEVALIAEVKRRSPGAGAIRPDLDPVELAGGYAASGAAAVSVLTDRTYFGGSLEDLGRIRSSVDVPLLRKDFTLAPEQVWEARAAGADCVLLIVRILDQATLRTLLETADESGLAALVEVHDRAELERALDAGAAIVGVNNRDLGTFTTELDVTLRLLDGVPDDVVLVSESGIRSGADVERLGGRGVDAVLVGESLLKADDPAAAAAGLAGRPRRERASARAPGER